MRVSACNTNRGLSVGCGDQVRGLQPWLGEAILLSTVLCVSPVLVLLFHVGGGLPLFVQRLLVLRLVSLPIDKIGIVPFVCGIYTSLSLSICSSSRIPAFCVCAQFKDVLKPRKTHFREVGRTCEITHKKLTIKRSTWKGLSDEATSYTLKSTQVLRYPCDMLLTLGSSLKAGAKFLTFVKLETPIDLASPSSTKPSICSDDEGNQG